MLKVHGMHRMNKMQRLQWLRRSQVLQKSKECGKTNNSKDSQHGRRCNEFKKSKSWEMKKKRQRTQKN